MLALATGPETSQVGFMFLVQLHQWGWKKKKKKWPIEYESLENAGSLYDSG